MNWNVNTIHQLKVVSNVSHRDQYLLSLLVSSYHLHFIRRESNAQNYPKKLDLIDIDSQAYVNHGGPNCNHEFY